MYGTREDLCRMLNEQYPAETPLNLIIWPRRILKHWLTGWNIPFQNMT